MHVEIKLDKDLENKISEIKKKYPKELFHIKGISHKQLNFNEFIDNFVGVVNETTTADASVDPNSNVSTKNIVTLINEMAKPSQKIIALNKLYIESKKKYGIEFANKWVEDELTNALYMSDLNTATFVPYCYNYDLSFLSHKGLFFLDNISSLPPQHLDTFVSHTLETIVYLCNSTSGATGIASWLIEAFYFWNKDRKEGYGGDSEKYKTQQFQNFYYSINQPYTRSGIQSAFINLNLMDRNYIYGLFGDKSYPDGSYIVDFVEEIMQFQMDFMDFLTKERAKKFMTFPVLCACLIYKDGKFDDEDFAKYCVGNNMNYYDYNFYLSDSVDSLSSCCRLTSSTKSMGLMNSIGGSELNIGSIKVETVNLARIAYESDSVDSYINILEERVNTAVKILDVQRDIINRNIDKGLLPLYNNGIIDISRQYSTIGLNGLFETLHHFDMVKKDELGNTNYTKDGINFAEKIMSTINNIKDRFTDKYLFNTEFVPAESMSYKLCESDTLIHGDKVKFKIYGNQYIPLDVKTTLNYRVELASILDKYSQGGCSTHLNLESGFSNFEQAWSVFNSIAEKEISLFCFNHKIKICEDSHGFLHGDICPTCGKPVYDTMQKIVGYITPSKAYSKQRKEEFENRVWNDVK